MNLKVKVKLMDQHGIEVIEMKILYYDCDANATFGDLFAYINAEKNLEERDYFPSGLGQNMNEKIMQNSSGSFSSSGIIDWDFNLKNCEIIPSLELISTNPESTTIEIIYTGPIGSGGAMGLSIEEIKLIIDTFGSILDVAIKTVELGTAVAVFINFLEAEKDVTKERIFKTIKKKHSWKKGFSSKEEFEGKDIVEKSIMEDMEYTYEEETQTWIDRSCG